MPRFEPAGLKGKTDFLCLEAAPWTRDELQSEENPSDGRSGLGTNSA